MEEREGKVGSVEQNNNACLSIPCRVQVSSKLNKTAQINPFTALPSLSTCPYQSCIQSGSDTRFSSSSSFLIFTFFLFVSFLVIFSLILLASFSSLCCCMSCLLFLITFLSTVPSSFFSIFLFFFSFFYYFSFLLSLPSSSFPHPCLLFLLIFLVTYLVPFLFPSSSLSSPFLPSLYRLPPHPLSLSVVETHLFLPPWCFRNCLIFHFVLFLFLFLLFLLIFHRLNSLFLQ